MVRVQIGNDQPSAWLPFCTTRAGGDVTWWAPEVGEQVLVLALNGDLQEAYVLPLAIYSDAKPEPKNNPNVHYTRYADGTTVEYDRTTHQMTINCIGEVDVTSPQINLRGDVDVFGELTYHDGMYGSGGSSTAILTGNVQVVGNLSATGSITDGNGDGGA
jgi:phage baseplate assembly protein V